MKQLLIISLSTIFFLTGCHRKTFDEQMEERAKEMTAKQCPKKRDDFTTLDSLKYDASNKTLHYYHSFSGKLDNDTIYDKYLTEELREQELSNIRNNLEIKKEKEEGITYHFHYLSESTGKELLNFVFTKVDYTTKLAKQDSNYRRYRKWKAYSQINCPIVQEDGKSTLDSIWYDTTANTLYFDYTLQGKFDAEKDSLSISKKMLIQYLIENQEIIDERNKDKMDFGVRYYSGSNNKLITKMVVKNQEIK